MPYWPMLMSRLTPVSTASPFLCLCLYTSLSPLSVLPAPSFLFYICLCFSLSPSIFLSLGDTHMNTLAPYLPAHTILH